MSPQDVVQENLRLAIKDRNIEKVRGIISTNPEIVHLPLKKTQCTPLWEAMFRGHHEIVELLVDSGANVNERFSSEKNKFRNLTFLQCLALQGGFWKSSKKIAKLLISRGADVNANYEDGSTKTALKMALTDGNVSYSKFLLKNGAKLRGPMTCILSAPKCKQKELLQLLIKHGLDLNYRNKDGGNYLHLTISNAVSQQTLDIEVVEIAKILLNNGISVKDLDKNGQSPLHYAVIKYSPVLVSLLIEKGADVNAKNRKGIFPLYLAAQQNNINLVEYLLSNGAEINAQTECGDTVLHAACHHRHERLVNLLIRRGVNISVENIAGWTPFAILNPKHYKQFDIPCIRAMVKEIAKVKYSRAFRARLLVSDKDMNLIQAHPTVEGFYHGCMKELYELESTKFYSSYSYYSILMMTEDNIHMLSNLTSCADFVVKFEAYLYGFSYYRDDLRMIFDEAVKMRNKSVKINCKLDPTFEKSKSYVEVVNLEDDAPDQE